MFGHLFKGTRADSWYYGGVFTGTGRGGGNNDDGQMMWAGRYQWNFLGRDLPFAQSDVEYHDEPAASVAFAAATNRSPFTRFSSSGGGQLVSFGLDSMIETIAATALSTIDPAMAANASTLVFVVIPFSNS